MLLGVGNITSKKLWKKGFHTIEDLKARGQSELNEQQKIGLKYYEVHLLCNFISNCRNSMKKSREKKCGFMERSLRELHSEWILH